MALNHTTLPGEEAVKKDLPSGPIIWRTSNDPEGNIREGDRAILRCEDESLTVQSFAQDADLNVLAKRFGINGIPMHPVDPSHYRDTSEDPQLRDILDAQRDAQHHFNALPAKLRKRFHNSPKELWNFLQDPENADEAVRLGILSRDPEPEAIPKEPKAAPPETPPQKETPVQKVSPST